MIEQKVLEECSCGCSMFTEVRPVEIEQGALTVYSPGSNVQVQTTVPVLQCITCGRLIATRTSFSGRNRLDPEVQMYARLMDVITAHNKLILERENYVKQAGEAGRQTA